MTEMSDSEQPSKLTHRNDEEQLPLDLLPSFAAERGTDESWSPLVTTNADYERLWSVSNGWAVAESKPPANEGPEPAAGEPRPAEEAPRVDDPRIETEPPGEAPPSEVSLPADTPTPGFTGTLVTGSEVLNASIVVGGGRIILWGGGAEIGSWEHSHAKIARLTFARFAIQAEGETLTFTADDPSGLDKAVTAATSANELPVETVDKAQPIAEPQPPPLVPAPPTAIPETMAPPPSAPETPGPNQEAPAVRRPRIKSFKPATTDASAAPQAVEPAPEVVDVTSAAEEEETIADTVRARSDRTTVKARRFMPNDLRGIVVKSGVIVILLAVLAGAVYVVMLLMGRVGDPSATEATVPVSSAPPITVVITTAPPVTVTTAAPLPDTTFFETDPAILTERWNALAEVSAPNMVLFSDLSSPFILLLTPNVTLEGVLDSVTGNATLRATPTGTPEGDGAILAALGILIGTADPTLDGVDRKALLAQLGLDVDRPELGGIEGSLNYNGLAYRMVYQADQNTLELVITPEGAATTTAAN